MTNHHRDRTTAQRRTMTVVTSAYAMSAQQPPRGDDEYFPVGGAHRPGHERIPYLHPITRIWTWPDLIPEIHGNPRERGQR